ncbi:hypothetical protein OG338_28310 [Streptomyces sp. NBC_00726]|uniref:hypothetical protein n=1 Tax=Streptomyces sp. NBC_00726 TaxID=2903674 RepID=UPI00386D5BF6
MIGLAAADAYEVGGYARVEVTLRSGTRAWVYLDRASAETDTVREWLRSIEVFAGPLPDFDPAVAPAEPVGLFIAWLRAALAAGVPDAHAMTLLGLAAACGRDSGSTSAGATDQLRTVLTEAGACWVVDTVACRGGPIAPPDKPGWSFTRRWEGVDLLVCRLGCVRASSSR